MNPEMENQEDLNQPVIEVPLEKPAETVGEKKPERDALEEAKVWQRRMEYQTRLMERQNRENQELKEILKRVVEERQAPRISQSTSDDPIDQVAQRDWKEGVRLVWRAERERELLQQKEEEKRYSKERELEESRTRVRDRYPNIDDPNDETTKLYIQIQNENPSFLKNTRGPELVMYEMEKRMAEMGRVTPEMRPVIQKEMNRRIRANASSAPNGRPQSQKTYPLTREQLEIAKNLNISPETYAKTARALESGEGIEG